ncbi:MAG: PorV/PorQ family protein [candidate division Zixibacteria bacterium]
MRYILTFIIVVAAAVSSFGLDASRGSSGAQFLEIGVGSRYQGMGEASAATAGDVYAMYWNPAGLTEIENAAVSFTNVNWLLDIDLNYVGYAKYFEDVGVFGISATLLSMDKQEITTLQDQDGTGQFYSASSYAVGVSFARQLTTKFAFGATVKYVGEKIDFVKSQGIAFDFGTMLYTGYRSLRLGMSITNMGPNLRFDGNNLEVGYDALGGSGSNSEIQARLVPTGYAMPLAFRFGIAYDMDIGPMSTVTLAADLEHPNDLNQQGALGAEFGYDNRYFLRGGYKINSDEETLSFGGGLDMPISGSSQIQIDYAWQDFGRLSTTHRFSVGFTF